MLYGRLLLLAPTKTNAKLAVQVPAFIVLAIPTAWCYLFLPFSRSMQRRLFFDADKHNLRVQYDNAYREAMHGRRVMLVDKR